MNRTVVLNSIFALVFIYLTFKVNWLFLIGAVALMLINQRILLKSKK